MARTMIARMQEMDPLDFQRLVVDLLRADVSGRAWIRCFELPPGVQDGGWDAEIQGSYETLTGTIRVEVKRSPDYAASQKELSKYLKKPALLAAPADPVLFVTAAELTQPKCTKLQALGGSRRIRVLEGGDLASLARTHAHVSRAHGLIPSDESGIVPLEILCADAGERGVTRLPSERAAVAEIRAKLAEPTLFLVADPLASAERVLRSLAASLREAPVDQMLTLWVQPDARPSDLKRVIQDFGSIAQPIRFLIPPGVDAEAIRLLANQTGSRLVVASTSAVVTRQALAIARRSPVELRLKEPSPREILDWAKARAPQVPELLRQEAVLGLVRDDLVDLWINGWDLLVATLAQETPAPVLQAAAVVGVLSRVDDEELPAVARGLGSGEALLRERLQEGVKLHLLRRDTGRYAPLGDWLGDLLVVAHVRDLETRREMERVLANLPTSGRHRALSRLAQLQEGAYGSDPPAQLAVELIQALTPEEQRALRREAPAAWWASEVLFRQALRDAAGDVGDAEGRHVGTVLVRAVERWPRCVTEAWKLVESLGRGGLPLDGQDGVREIIEAMLSPSSMPPVRATAVLDLACSRVKQAPDRLLATMAAESAQVWTDSGHTRTEAFRTGVQIGFHGWGAPSADRDEAFAAAGRVIEALLTSPAAEGRDLGWTAIRGVLRRQGPGLGKPPEKLVEIGRSLVRGALRRLVGEEDWVERAVAEGALCSLLGRWWMKPLRRSVLEVLNRDPLYLVFRATFSRQEDALVLDVDHALEVYERDPDTAWEEVFGWKVRETRLAAVLDRVIVSGSSTSDLERVLVAGEQLQARVAPARADINGLALLRWAERQPAVFAPLVLGPRWASWSSETRKLLVWSTAGVLGAELQEEGAEPMGVRVDLARYFARPAATPAERALELLPLVKSATIRRNLGATLTRLAAHPHPAVQAELWSWLCVAHQQAPLDPRDVEAVLRALVDRPGRLDILSTVAGSAAWRGAGDRAPIRLDVKKHPTAAEDPRLDATEILLDALERNLIKEHRRDLHHNTRHALRPLMTTLARRRPKAWWRRVPPFLTGAPREIDMLFDRMEDEDWLGLLAAGPSSPTERPERIALELLVRSISPEILVKQVEALIPGDLDRAVTWLSGAHMHPALIPATIGVLTALREVDPERVAPLVRCLGTGSGLKGFSIGAVWIADPFTGPTPLASPGDPVADAYARAADEQGGLVGDHLREMARLRRLAYGIGVG